MPNTQQKQGAVFKPVHEAHAIEQASLVVRFDKPIGDDNMAAVLEIAEEFKSELPGSHLTPAGIPFMMGDPAVMGFPFLPPQHISSVGGILRSRTAPDGSIESELRLEPVSMSFRTTVYTRWPTVFGAASKYFASVIDAYLSSGANVADVNLTFVDKFVWDGSPMDCDPRLLIKENSKYLASHVFSMGDLWHVHTGAFEKKDSNTKRLVNVNIDCLDDSLALPTRRSIVITTVLTDMFNQPGYEPLSIPEGDGAAFVNQHLEDLHSYDKKILSEILVPSISKQIDLID